MGAGRWIVAAPAVAVLMAVAGVRGDTAPSDSAAPAPPAWSEGVDLVVLITVDQLRGDYLDRFADQLDGGLAWFRNETAYFPGARQHHAVPSTAPGHASLLSGRYPAHTGIVSNDSGVPDLTRRVLHAPEAAGASPHRFRGTTLYDWLRAADERARVLSVARKDRSAIMPIGRARGDVYWWAGGRFTTSDYYADALPAWARDANARIDIDAFVGREWPMLLPESAYPEPADRGIRVRGRGGFPHHLPAQRSRTLELLGRFPWMDSLTLDFALAGVHALELGRRGATDVLAIGLSTLDAIGHDFGPGSREVRDHVLRLDHWLGAFLDSLHAVVPRERTLLVLASDHGVSELPEVLLASGHAPAGRIDTDPVLHALRDGFEPRFATPFGFDSNHGLFLADTDALRARGVDVDSLARHVADELNRLDGVRRVFTPATLAAAPPDDYDAMLWRRSLHDRLGWLAIAVPEENHSFGRRTADHGHMQLDNMSIAIAFGGGGIGTRRHEGVIESVDVAPTLAALLGVRVLETVDGRVLREVMDARVAND